MLVAYQNHEYEIKNGTVLQEKTEGKWNDITIITEKGSALWAVREINKNPENFRVHPIAPIKKNRVKCECGGYLRVDRICEKCKKRYVLVGNKWKHMPKSESKTTREESDFIPHINERINFFKMPATGSARVDDHLMKKENYKPVSMKKKAKSFCEDGKYRVVEYEHVGPEVRLICTYLEIVSISLGEEIVKIISYGKKHGLVVKKYSGTMPTQAMTFMIKEL